MDDLEKHIAVVVKYMADHGVNLDPNTVGDLLLKLNDIWECQRIRDELAHDFKGEKGRKLPPDLASAVRFKQGEGRPIEGTETWDTPLYIKTLMHFIPVIDRFADEHGFPQHGEHRSYRIRPFDVEDRGSGDGKMQSIAPHHHLALAVGRCFDWAFDIEHWSSAHRRLIGKLKTFEPAKLNVTQNEKGERVIRQHSTYKPGLGMYERAKQETDGE